MKIWIIHFSLLVTVSVSSTNIELSSAPVTLPDPQSLINSVSCAIFDIYKASVVAVHKKCSDVLERSSDKFEIEEKEIRRETLSVLTDITTNVDAVFDNFNAALRKLSTTIEEASNLGQTEIQPVLTVWNELKYGVPRLKRNIRLIRANMNKRLTQIKEDFDEGTQQFEDAMSNLYSKVLKKLCFEVRSATNMFQHALSLPTSIYYEIELEEIYENWIQFLQLTKETPINLLKSAKSLLNQLYDIIQAKFFLSGVLSDNSLWPVSSLVWGDAVQVKHFVDNSLKHLARFIKTSLAGILAKFGKDNFASQEAIQSLYNQIFKEIKQLIATTEIPFKRIYNFDVKKLPFTIPNSLDSIYSGSFDDLLRYLEAGGHPVQRDIAECQNIVLQIPGSPHSENSHADNFFQYTLSNVFTKSSQSNISPLYSMMLQKEHIQEITKVYKNLFDLAQKCVKTADEDGYKLSKIISMKMYDDAYKYKVLMDDFRSYTSRCACFIEKSYDRSGQEYKDIMTDFCASVQQKLDIAAGYTLNFIQRIDSYLKNHQGCLEKFSLNSISKEEIIGDDNIPQTCTSEDETKVMTDETISRDLETSAQLVVNYEDQMVDTKSQDTVAETFMDEQPNNIEELGITNVQKKESTAQMDQNVELYASNHGCSNNDNPSEADLLVTHQKDIATSNIDLKIVDDSMLVPSEKDIELNNIEDLNTNILSGPMKSKGNSDLKSDQEEEIENLISSDTISNTDSMTKATMTNTAVRSVIIKNEETSSSTSQTNSCIKDKPNETMSETIIQNEASSEENQPDNIEEKRTSSEETQSITENICTETSHEFIDSISLTGNTNLVHSSSLICEKDYTTNVDLQSMNNFESISETEVLSKESNKLEKLISNVDQVIESSNNFSAEKSIKLLEDTQQIKHDSEESHIRPVMELSVNKDSQSLNEMNLEQKTGTISATESTIVTKSKEDESSERKCVSTSQNTKDIQTEKEWSVDSKTDLMIGKNELELIHNTESYAALLDISSTNKEDTSVSIEKEIDLNGHRNLKSQVKHKVSHESSNQDQISCVDGTIPNKDSTIYEVLSSNRDIDFTSSSLIIDDTFGKDSLSTVNGENIIISKDINSANNESNEKLAPKMNSLSISVDNQLGSSEEGRILSEANKEECSAMSSFSAMKSEGVESDLSSKLSTNLNNLSDEANLAAPINLKSITTTGEEIVNLIAANKENSREYIVSSVTPHMQNINEEEVNKITLQHEETQKSELSSMIGVFFQNSSSQKLDSEVVTEDKVSSSSAHRVEDFVASEKNIEKSMDSIIAELASDYTTRSLASSEVNQNSVSSFSTHEEMSEMEMYNSSVKNVNNEQIIASSSINSDIDNVQGSAIEIDYKKNDIINEEIVTNISSGGHFVSLNKEDAKIADEPNSISIEDTAKVSSKSVDVDVNVIKKDLTTSHQEMESIIDNEEKSPVIGLYSLIRDQSAEECLQQQLKESQLEIEDNLEGEQKIMSVKNLQTTKNEENDSSRQIINSATEHSIENLKLDSGSSTVNKNYIYDQTEGSSEKNNLNNIGKFDMKLAQNSVVSTNEETACNNVFQASETIISEKGSSGLDDSIFSSNSDIDYVSEENQIVHSEFHNQAEMYKDQSLTLESQETQHKPVIDHLKDIDSTIVETNTRSIIDTTEAIYQGEKHTDSITADHGIVNCGNLNKACNIDLNDAKKAQKDQINSSMSGKMHHKDIAESYINVEQEATVLDKESSFLDSDSFASKIENESSNSFTTSTTIKSKITNEDETKSTGLHECTSLDDEINKDKIAITKMEGSSEKVISDLDVMTEKHFDENELTVSKNTQHESPAKTDLKIEKNGILSIKGDTSDLITRPAEDEKLTTYEDKCAIESQSATLDIDYNKITSLKEAEDESAVRKNYNSDMVNDISDEQIKLTEIINNNENEELQNRITLEDMLLNNIAETNLHTQGEGLLESTTSMGNDSSSQSVQTKEGTLITSEGKVDTKNEENTVELKMGFSNINTSLKDGNTETDNINDQKKNIKVDMSNELIDLKDTKKTETSMDSSVTTTIEKVQKGDNSNETPFYNMLWFPNQKWKTKAPTLSSSSTDDNYGWFGWLVPGMRGFPESGKSMNPLKEKLDSDSSNLITSMSSSERLEMQGIKNFVDEDSCTHGSNFETSQSSFSKTETKTNESTQEILKIERSDASNENKNKCDDFLKDSINDNGKTLGSSSTGNIANVQSGEPTFFKKWYNSLIKT